MRARLSFALTALTLLFTLQGLSVLISASFPLVYDAVFPLFRPARLAGLIIPVGALLAPALPFSRWLDRGTVLLGAAIATAALRVPLALPDPVLRLVLGAAVVAAGGIFLGKAVGYLDRRAVAAGTAAALLLDQLLHSAGWSWDVTLRTGWIPAQVLLSAAATMIAVRWKRAPEDDEEEEVAGSLERRAGGLRLRGAVALGALLFLETAILARPAVAARWSGASFEVLSIAMAAAGAAAILAIILRGPYPRGRMGVAALTATIAVAVLAPRPLSLPAWAAVTLVAAGHGAALLLLGRALVPAGGRRRGWTTATALALVYVLQALLSMTAFHAFTFPRLAGASPWLIGGAALLLWAAIAVLPRPTAALIRRPRWPGAVATVGAVAAAAALVTFAPGPVRRVPEGDALIVATYNVHYGFSEQWRHDPEATARAIEATGADVIALQEVTAGLPAAYGVDLALWLGRRLGMSARFAPTARRLVGDAVLTRVPHEAFTTTRLPPPDTDPKQVARVRIAALGGFDFHATHLGLTEEERAVQVAAIIAAIGPGPSVLAGDLNAGPADAVIAALRAGGFRDVFDASGTPPSSTWPAGAPERRIDWLWVRGLEVRMAGVSDATASDHRPVYAEIVIGR